MTDKVIDASAIAAIIFQEDAFEDVYETLKGATLVAPELLPFEIANVCVKKIKRHGLATNIEAALKLFQRFDIQYVAVDVAGVCETSLIHNLSAYDASYLWLAKENDCELVTLDARLKLASQAR